MFVVTEILLAIEALVGLCEHLEPVETDLQLNYSFFPYMHYFVLVLLTSSLFTGYSHVKLAMFCLSSLAIPLARRAC